VLVRDFGAEHHAGALAEDRRVLRDAFTGHGAARADTQCDAMFVPGTIAGCARSSRGRANLAGLRSSAEPRRSGARSQMPVQNRPRYFFQDGNRGFPLIDLPSILFGTLAASACVCGVSGVVQECKI
jgi:hypothetical protein